MKSPIAITVDILPRLRYTPYRDFKLSITITTQSHTQRGAVR